MITITITGNSNQAKRDNLAKYIAGVIAALPDGTDIDAPEDITVLAPQECLDRHFLTKVLK